MANVITVSHLVIKKLLNQHIDYNFSFFFLEVYTYKISESDVAPMFKIIEQPNDFAKTVRSISNNAELNNSQKSRLEFWNIFNGVIELRGKPFNKHKATTGHWYTVAIGSSKCNLSIDLVNKDNKNTCKGEIIKLLN